MSKHLTNKQIEGRLGAVMNAYKEENSNSVFNLNCVASLLEKGGYNIIVDDKIKSAQGRNTNESVAKSIRRLTSFVNRVSDIVHKGSEEHSLDNQIDLTNKFWIELKTILEETK